MSNNDEIIQLGDADFITMTGQVTQSIRTGLPLESGLRALAEQTRSRRSRQALIRMSESLEQGLPLVDALRVSDAALPRTMRVLVDAGLQTGRLDHVMQYCVEQSQRAISLRQQIWMFLSYPLFLIWFAMLICGGILLTIVPSFKKIFDDFGTEMPGLTVVLINFSDAMVNFGFLPWLTLMLFGPLAAFIVLTMGLSKSGHHWATSIPLIGRVFRDAALTDLCQLLAILVESGLSFPKALRFSGDASEDRWLKRKCLMVADDIDQGSTAEAGARLAALPNSMTQVFRGTNSERTFAEALRGLADIYSAQCFVTSQLINAVVAPFAVTAVIGFVGLTAIALFMPLIKLLNDLS